MAYHVVGRWQVLACLEHLGLRECHLGGYELRRVSFTQSSISHAAPLSTLVFIASPSNHLYLGPAAVDELARQVTSPARSRRTFPPSVPHGHLFSPGTWVRVVTKG